MKIEWWWNQAGELQPFVKTDPGEMTAWATVDRMDHRPLAGEPATHESEWYQVSVAFALNPDDVPKELLVARPTQKEGT